MTIMEKFKTIQEDIENVTNQKVVKKGKISLVAIALIIIAVILVDVGMGSEDPKASWLLFCLLWQLCYFRRNC